MTNPESDLLPKGSVSLMDIRLNPFARPMMYDVVIFSQMVLSLDNSVISLGTLIFSALWSEDTVVHGLFGAISVEMLSCIHSLLIFLQLYEAVLTSYMKFIHWINMNG